MDGQLLQAIAFDPTSRHATVLVSRLDELLGAAGLAPGDIDEVYVSIGPGGFTGLRVGLTAARTLGQAIDGLRCVGVPTAYAVAQNVRDVAWEHLGTVADAKPDGIYAQLFVRHGQRIVAQGPAVVGRSEEFLASSPRPILLIGEGLEYHDLAGLDVESAEPSLHMPTAEGVWHVGRQMASAGDFTHFNELLPIYTSRPKALRQLQQRRTNDAG